MAAEPSRFNLPRGAPQGIPFITSDLPLCSNQRSPRSSRGKAPVNPATSHIDSAIDDRDRTEPAIIFCLSRIILAVLTKFRIGRIKAVQYTGRSTVDIFFHFDACEAPNLGFDFNR